MHSSMEFEGCTKIHLFSWGHDFRHRGLLGGLAAQGDSVRAIPFGEDTGQFSRVVDDRQRADLLLVHQV
jgi:hypothetical protein